MRNNKHLKAAKRAKNDEFYTLYEDIEKEMKYYIQHFENKIIYCNCDDYNKSNFFKYFHDNFNQFKLKKLITTSYNENGNGLYSEYDGKTLITGELKSNGSFKSEESIEYLKQCDIVVTNPPFSLFREYIKMLFDFNKKFCILSNINAITYKDVFSHIKNGEVWLGYNFNIILNFITSNGNKTMNICWFTNIENNKEQDTISLIKTYNPTDYPTYDNYDAINVTNTKDIPYDYDGVIGVPITALKYLYSDGLLHFDTPMRERRYELVKFRKGNDDKDLSINGKTPYFRVLIKSI